MPNPSSTKTVLIIGASRDRGYACDFGGRADGAITK
jgi:hypothetical protein